MKNSRNETKNDKVETYDVKAFRQNLSSNMHANIN